MKHISSLKKKLAGYSAMAAAMIAAGGGKSDAQIIYHDIIPDTTLASSDAVFYIDLNNDDLIDLGFSWGTGVATFGLYGVMYFYTSTKLLQKNYGFHRLEALGSCDNISLTPPIGDNWDGGGGSAFMLDDTEPSPWINNEVDAYAAFQIHFPDGNHFGWIRMTCNPATGYDGDMTIKDYAYQAIPDSSITTPCHQQINEIASTLLFSVLTENNQLIIQFHQLPMGNRITLLNEMGMQLYEQPISQTQIVIDVSELSSGIYFIVVEDEKGNQVKKIVID